MANVAQMEIVQKATLLLFYHKNVTTLLAKAIDCGLHFYLDGLEYQERKKGSKIEAAFI